MDIRHLRYFVAVANALSFGVAARELHMSQPPLSKRIAEMEDELGVRLFDRTSRRVALTTAGETFLPRAQEAVRSFDAAIRTAQELSPSRSRRLNIAVPPETSRNVVLEVVNALSNQKVEVHVTEANTAEQQHLLASGEIDIGVLRHPFDRRGLRISTPLAQPLGVIVEASHPIAQLESVRLSDLRPYALIHFQRNFAPGLYDELLTLCRDGGYVPPRILHGVRTTATLLKTEGAVTLAPLQMIKRRGEGGSGEFVWKPLEGSPIRWWTSVVCRTKEWDSLKRTAIDVIVSSLQKLENWTPAPRTSASMVASSTTDSD